MRDLNRLPSPSQRCPLLPDVGLILLDLGVLAGRADLAVHRFLYNHTQTV